MLSKWKLTVNLEAKRSLITFWSLHDPLNMRSRVALIWAMTPFFEGHGDSRFLQLLDVDLQGEITGHQPLNIPSSSAPWFNPLQINKKSKQLLGAPIKFAWLWKVALSLIPKLATPTSLPLSNHPPTWP